MAKKEKLKLDDFNIDNDLDFDFGIEDIDSSINPEATKADRKPVKDVFKGTIQGAKSKLKDPAFLSQTMQASLPKQYGEVFTAADKVTSSLSSLYDETIREVKPELSRIAKKVDRLVPEESKFFKRLTGKFSELMGNEFSDFKKATKEQLQEQGIATSIASIFEAQQETDAAVKAREASEGRIDKAIEQKRFTSNFTLLSSINEGVTRLRSYNDKVTQAYQRKSLELQYRSYYVQAELLANSKQYFEVFQKQNEAITKNTALPEFVKVTESERFKELAKSKFYSSVQKSLFGDSDIVATAMKRLREKAKTTIANFKQGLEMGAMGLETLESMQEQQRDMASMGMDMPGKYELGGNMLGGMGVEMLGHKLGKTARAATPKDSPLARYGYKAANFLKNPQAASEEMRNSRFMQENRFGGGVKGAAASLGDLILDLVKAEKPDMKLNSGIGLGNLDAIAPGFTNRAMKSITDVIPGYLARIHHEVVMMRNQDTASPMVVYDYTKGQFTTSTKFSKDVKDLLRSKVKGSQYSGMLDRALQSLMGDQKLEGDEATQAVQKKDLKRLLSKLSTQTMTYTPENIYQSEEYARSPAKVAFKRLLDAKISKASESEKGQYEFTSAMTDIKNATPDVRGIIEKLVDEGYSEQLEAEGVIKRDETGKLEINFEAYKKMLEDEGITVSDVNVKRGIKSINPKDALAAVKRTKIYDWFYKQGKGDQKPHTGPMAQDVKANLGEEAAPGGIKIDLTTMNGVNMAAIQALHDEQSKQSKSDSSKTILQTIKKDTGTIVELMSKGGGGFGLGGSVNTDKLKEILESRKGFYTSVVEPTVKGAFDAMGKVFGVAKQGAVGAKDKVAVPLMDYISKAYGNNKDAMKSVFTTMFKGAGQIIENIYDFGKDLITNKVPTGIKNIKDLFTATKDKIVGAIQGAIDVHVKGNLKTPLLRANLMRMGHYIDETTGKIVKSIEDIKGPVKNIYGETVLTLEDIAKGLVDNKGKPIKTVFEKLATAAWGTVQGGFKRVKDFYSNIAGGAIPDRVKKLFSSSDSLGGGKTYDILVQIRDILAKSSGVPTGESGGGETETTTEEASEGPESLIADTSPRYRSSGNAGSIINAGKKAYGAASDRFKAAGGFGGIKDSAKAGVGGLVESMKGKSVLGKLKGAGGFLRGGLKGLATGALSMAGGMFSSPDQGSQQEPVEEHRDDPTQEPTDAKGKITKTVKKLSDRAKAAWNDRDASGRRDGDWRDRLEAAAEKAKNKPAQLKADLTARYRTSESVLDLIAKQASGLFGSLSKGTSGILDTIGSVVEAGAGSLGLGKLGGLLKGLPGKIKGLPGMLLRGGKAATGLIGKGVGLLGKIGTPIVGAISKVKNVASIARLASMANTARTALTVGSLMSGGVLSTAMGAAATGLTALGSVLVSPVAIGAIAVAATAYVGYKAYKYFTRDNVDKFSSIRVKQYGLANSEKDQHHIHHLLQLEEYLQDGRIGYDRGKAYLLPKKIDMVEMLGIFEIDAEDQEMTNRYTEWFEYRFKPFFLTNVTALYSIDNKAKLSEVAKLKSDEQSKFLNLSSYESGPYDVQVSPFKDIDRLNTDPKVTKDMVKYAQDMIKLDVAKKGTTPKDQPAKAGFMTKQPIRDEKKGGEQYVLKPEPEKLPKTNLTPGVKDAAIMDGNRGEDGLMKTSTVALDKANPIAASAAKVNVATGPMRDGESGMQYMKIQPGVRIDGLNPSLLNQFKSMVQEYGETTGKSVIVTSGYRDAATQEALYKQDPTKAAKPGRSLHEFGLALDVNSADLDELDKLGLMRKYGFTRPVGGEPWHTEAAGIQVNLDKAKKDPMFATQAIEASLLRGGGGLGSIEGSPLRKRDTDLALKTMDIDAKVVKSDKDKANEILKPTKIPNVEEEPKGQTFGTPKSNVIQASFGGSPVTTTNGYSGSVANTQDPRDNVVAINGPSPGGYSSSVAATVGQSEAYSKNDSLFEPESRPTLTGGDAGKPVVQPKNVGEVVDIIKTAANKAGVDPSIMTSMAAVESGFNPNARAGSSSAKGLFQFLNATWNTQIHRDGSKYGLTSETSPFDPMANSLMGSEFVKDNLQAIKDVKPNPNLTDAYMAHFLGAGGARKFLRAMQTNPNAIGSVLFPNEANANPGVFKPGGRALTLQQIYQTFSQKLATKAKAYGVTVPESSTGSINQGQMGSEPIVGSPLPNQQTGTSEAPGTRTSSSDWKIVSNGVNNQPSDGMSANVYDTQSSAGSNYGAITEQKQPTFGQPAISAFPTPTSTGQGQGFNIGGLEAGINHVGETLDKSLGVQTEMLSTLKEILANVNPQNIQQVQEGLKQVADQAKPVQSLSKPAIDLARRSA